MSSVIDRLPIKLKSRVVDAIVADRPINAVAQLAGVSATAIARYKRTVVLPALADSAKVQSAERIIEESEVDTAARRLAMSSPVRARIDQVWQAITPHLTNKAEWSLAVDKAHESIGLLGKLTGELADTPASQSNVQINLIRD